MSRTGFCYVLVNPGLPGIVKVGRTIRDTNERASELWREYGTEHPFTVVSKHGVSDCCAVEALAHKLLARYRVPRSELFECRPQEAQAAIRKAARMILWSPWYLRVWYWLMLPRPQRAPKRWRRARHSWSGDLVLVVIVGLVLAGLIVFKPDVPEWIPEAVRSSLLRAESLFLRSPRI